MLAAEKSKVPFYIAGGLLVVWALTLSLGLGMRKPDFPGSLGRPARGRRGHRGARARRRRDGRAHLGRAREGLGAADADAGTGAGPGRLRSVPRLASASTEPTATTRHARAGVSPAAGKAGTALTLAANPSGLLTYNTKQLSAKAGTVTITMTNMSPLEHNVTVAEGTKVLGATPTFIGGTRTLTLKLKPGKYMFYCSVPGHRQAGMEGTLNVS